MVFVAAEGTQVQASLFANQIENFQDTSKILKTYYISKAGVKFMEKKYQIVSHPCQWTIHANTLIQHFGIWDTASITSPSMQNIRLYLIASNAKERKLLNYHG